MKPRKRITRVISVAVIIFMLCALMPMNFIEANAESNEVTYTEGVEGGSITFDKSRGLITRISRDVVSLVIPETIEGVTVKGFDLPQYLPSLESLTLSSSIIDFDGFDIYGTQILQQIYIPDDNPAFKSIDGVAYSKDGTRLVAYPVGRKDMKYTVADTVTTIGKYAFYGNENIYQIVLPNKLKTIEDCAFDGCYYLSTFSFPSSLEYIGDLAFQGCEHFSRIIIPENVAHIGEGAFRVSNGLSEFVVHEKNKKFSSDEYGVLFNKSKTKLLRFPPNSPHKSYTIPDTVTTLAEEAFLDCFYIEKIVTSSNLVDIEDDEFYRNHELTLYVDEHSKAEWFAKENDIPYVRNEELVTNTDFYPAVHGNKFKHKGFNTYDIPVKEYKKKVLSGLNKNEKEAMQKIMDSEWNGSCAGLTALIALCYMGEIQVSGIQDYRYNFGDLHAPDKKDGKHLLSAINYYYILLNRPDILNKSLGSVQYINKDVLYNELIKNWISDKRFVTCSEYFDAFFKEIDNDGYSILLYTYKDEKVTVGHSILALNYEFNNDLNKYVVTMYDINQRNIFPMYVSKSKNNFEFVDFAGKTRTRSNCESLCYYDLSWIVNNDWLMPTGSGDTSELSLRPSMAISEVEDNEVPNDSVRLTFKYNSAFKMIADNNTTLNFDGEKLSGDIDVYDAYISDYSEEPSITLTVGGFQQATITEMSGDIDIDIVSPNKFISVKCENADELRINEEGKVELDGEDYSFTTYVSADDENSKLLKISGKGNEQTSITPAEDTVNMETTDQLTSMVCSAITDEGSQVIIKKDTVTNLQISGEEEYYEDESEKCGENLTWSINNDGVLTISGTGAMYDYDSSSPAPWTESEYKDSLKTLILEEGITSIGTNAFNGCSTLTGDLVIPSSVTSIGEAAFDGCLGLSAIVILNDECELLDDFSSACIVGYENSTAEKYCEIFSNEFKTYCEYFGHQYLGEWIVNKNATCTETGSKYKECSVCDAKISEEIKITGHGFGEWKVTTAPTCTKDGIETRICACGEKETRTVNPIDHDYKAVVTAPTCTEKGYTTYTCKNNAAHTYTDNYVDAKKHNHTAVVTEPTCTAAGYKTYTCACGDRYKADEVAALGHSFGEYVTTTKAGFDKAGEQTATCSICQATDAKTIAAAVVPVISDQTFNNKNKTPKITVVDTQGTPVEAKVTVANKTRKSVGKYKVTVKLTGNNYEGSKTVYFKINPAAKSISKLTAGKKAFTVKWSKPSSTYRKQITGYQIKYSTSSKMSKPKTVTVKTTKATSKTIKKLKAKKTYYVQLRTYKTMKGVKYYSSWSKTKKVKTK